MNIKIPLTDVTLGEEEARAAARVIRSGWVTMGAEVQAFEAEFAAALGARHAVAVTNGTAGLHLAYAAAGLGEGDEFLLPALTFIATMNAGLYLRARPVLVDCASEDDLTLSAEDLARKITPKTKLIVTMPYGGYAPDMEAIMRFANERGIAVVEDACHAPLAKLNWRCIGTFGAAGVFSFFSNKNLAIGEGGMVVSNDDEIASRLRLMRSHGMTTMTWDRHRGHAAEYDVVTAGFNYRLDEVRAAIGREQLKKLAAGNARRRTASRLMRECLNALEIKRLNALEIKSLKIPFENPRGESACHLFEILLPEGVNRADFRAALAGRGIQTSVHYPPLYSFTISRELGLNGDDLPVLRRLAARLVTLPMGPTLNEEQIDYVVEAVRSFING